MRLSYRRSESKRTRPTASTSPTPSPTKPPIKSPTTTSGSRAAQIAPRVHVGYSITSSARVASAACREGFRGTKRYGTWRQDRPGSIRFDAHELHDLTPLFRFTHDELAEVSRRTRKHRAAEVSEPRLHRGIGESHIDLLVECVDDLGGRVPGCAEAIPLARLEARQEFSH